MRRRGMFALQRGTIITRPEFGDTLVLSIPDLRLTRQWVGNQLGWASFVGFSQHDKTGLGGSCAH